MEHRIRHPKQVSVHNLRSSFTRQAQTNHDDRRTGGPPVLGQQAAGSRAPQNRAAPQAPRTDPRLPRISPYEIACKISTLTEHGALPNAPTPTAVRAAVASYCSSSQQGAALAGAGHGPAAVRRRRPGGREAVVVAGGHACHRFSQATLRWPGVSRPPPRAVA
jgi:hypothetical protein